MKSEISAVANAHITTYCNADVLLQRPGVARIVVGGRVEGGFTLAHCESLELNVPKYSALTHRLVLYKADGKGQHCSPRGGGTP